MVGLGSFLCFCVWVCFFSNDPRQHPAITADDLAALPARANNFQKVAALERPRVPWLRLARRMFPVTVVDFCYGWTLWLFLSWIPAFFFENYHLNLQSTAIFSAGVMFSGVVGDLVGGPVSDRVLRQSGSLPVARGSVLVAGP